MGKSSKSDDSDGSSSDSSREEEKPSVKADDKKENLISKKDSSEPKERRKHSKKLESDSSSSSSDSDEKKKKAKKAKKKSEKKEKKDKKIHKSDKDKKKKHHKKHHKKHKKKEKKYGKYGIITMTEMPSKREEYMHWLREVKNINIDEISHPQEKKLFEEYVEDYNTCSFKSKKYYNLREWEAKQENKKNRGKYVQTNVDPMSLIKNDEENLNEQRKQTNLKFQSDKIHAALYQLHNNQEMIQGMKEEQELKDKMKHYYKIGKYEEAQKISKLFEMNKQFKE